MIFTEVNQFLGSWFLMKAYKEWSRYDARVPKYSAMSILERSIIRRWRAI